MSYGKAIDLFQGNWFRRNDSRLDLTEVEASFIVAALGQSPKRWDAKPNLALMEELNESNPNLLSRIGSALLGVAIGMRGGGETVKFLIEHGCEYKYDRSEYNQLHEAGWANAVDTLQAIFESGIEDATPISVRPHTGWPDNLPLMYWAAWGGYPDLARLLLKHGAAIHHEVQIRGNGERGTTSLHEAVAPGPWQSDNEIRSNRAKLEVAQILIDSGAYYDVYSACGLDDVKRLEAIIEKDDSLASLSDEFGMTPLHWAARAGSTTCVDLLIKNSADINALNRNKRAPIQLAAEANQGNLIRLLGEHSADLNTQDRKGRTPLHRATYEGCVDAAETLLQIGADSSILNKSGKTAFEIARKEAKYFKSRVKH